MVSQALHVMGRFRIRKLEALQYHGILVSQLETQLRGHPWKNTMNIFMVYFYRIYIFIYNSYKNAKACFASPLTQRQDVAPVMLYGDGEGDPCLSSFVE